MTLLVQIAEGQHSVSTDIIREYTTSTGILAKDIQYIQFNTYKYSETNLQFTHRGKCYTLSNNTYIPIDIYKDETVYINGKQIGGKGGFGNNQRSKSARIGSKKVTDTSSCRDLQGRRLRHAQQEKELREWHTKKKMQPSDLQQAFIRVKQGKSIIPRICKFGEDCKYRTTTCRNVHPETDTKSVEKQQSVYNDDDTDNFNIIAESTKLPSIDIQSVKNVCTLQNIPEISMLSNDSIPSKSTGLYSDNNNNDDDDDDYDDNDDDGLDLASIHTIVSKTNTSP